MRHPRHVGLFSLLLAGSMCTVMTDAPAAGKRPSARSGTKAPAKPAAESPADESPVASTPAASTAPAPKSCKKAEPVVSTCAPNKVLLPPAVSSPFAEGQISEMVAADVNGDGRTDLILSHGSSFVEVLLSKGDGTFESGPKIEERVNGEGLVVADFDGDCKPDVLVSSFEGSHSSTAVNFYAGKGNGSFRLGVTNDLTQSNISTLAAADFNADGKLDFFYNGYMGPTLVYNSGKARFGASGITHAVGGGPYTAGDLTGDGAAELVSTIDDRSVEKVCVRANNGNGQFDDPVCSPLSPSVRPLALSVVDLNGDGQNDVVVCSDNLTSEGGSTIFNVFLNKGDGTLGARATYSVPPGSNAMTVADVNNDGKPELVAFKSGENSGISILKNKGDGTFAAKVEQYPIGGSTQYPHELIVQGDFKGNGLRGFAALDRNNNAVSVISAECKP